MSADPRFLDSWLAARPPPKVSGSLQVRLDAPSGITHAPDQTDPHTASRRLFAVPKLPEPPELLYDFEDEIIGYERAMRREPTFVLGDDDADGMTPAQMLAAEYRDKDTGGQDVQPDKNPVAEDHASAQEPATASAEPEASSPPNADEPEALVERVSDMHLAPGNADEPPTDTDDVEPRGFAFSTDDADEDITKNVWESVFTSRQSSAAPPSVSDKASEAKGAAPAAEHAAPVTDDVRLTSRRALGNLTTAITTMRFSHDAQLLAIASRNKKDALRMVHVPTLQTYSNWPTAGTPLGHVTALDFSSESRYMAIGNSRGRVLLYALRSYVS